jgi:hypothetical protein
MYDYVNYFNNKKLFYPAGGVPTDILTVFENENIYLRIAYSVPGAMNCDVFYPNGTTEALVSNSASSSPNHWGEKGKFLEFLYLTKD